MPIRLDHALTASLILAAFPTVAPAAAAVEAKTGAAVRAVDDAWGAAEMRGDAGFVDRLLLPEYRSIGPTGKVTTKAAIVARVSVRKGSTGIAPHVEAWRVAHPVRSEVTIVGDTAVLTWISTKAGSNDSIASCDIFIYRDGHWHAIYSQHSSAGA